MTELDTNENEQRREDVMIREALNKLAEHFDSVRIFVTMPGHNDGQATNSFSEGRGNFYAQLGQIQDWLVRQRVRIETNENSVQD